LVNVSNEDYLKNGDNEKLKRFKEINRDILNSRCLNPNMDINDPKVIQKLKIFGRSSSGNQHLTPTTDPSSSVNPTDSKALASASTLLDSNDNVIGTVKTPASHAVFQDIWETCKETTRNDNPSLLTETLEQYNLDVNSIYSIYDPYYTGSLLLHAIDMNDIDVMKFLLAINNIGVNNKVRKNGKGRTALMLIAINNQIDVIGAMLNVVDIDVNKTDDAGWTALIWAAYWNRIDVVRVLVNVVDIDVNKADGRGMTAWMLSAYWNNIDVVHVLVNVVDIDVNKTSDEGVTALKYAEDRGYNKIVELLKKLS